MTDPLSITAACVGLLAGIQSLSSSLTRFVGNAQGARGDVEGFHRELQSLLPCVEALRGESFPFPDASRAQLIRLLDDCEDVIDEMKAIVKKHRRSRHSHTGKKIMRSAQWSVTDGDEVDRLRRRLESFKSTCNITLAMAKCITDHASFTEIKQTLDSLKLQVAALQQSNGSPQNPLLQRYLDETISYAESIIDPLDVPDDVDDATPSAASDPAPAAIHESTPAVEAPRSLSRKSTVLNGTLSCYECDNYRDNKKISRALPCGHHICHRCLKNKFDTSLTNRALMPPRCCTDQHIDLKHVDRLLNVEFKKKWNRKFREFKTKDPLYCDNSACREWISPNHIKTEKGLKVGRCRFCETKAVQR
jgi:hypothetical protein